MTGEILIGDVREQLRTRPAKSVHCVVTSPPYWALRDYGVAGQLGLEASPEAYVAAMVEVFSEVWRVLRDDGTLWLNIGDSYSGGGRGNFDVRSENRGNGASRGLGRPSPSGLKPKDLVGIPWRLAFALQAADWYLRSDIIWSKPSPMPESVRDRPTKSHEYVFLLTKSERYFYDAVAVREPAVVGVRHTPNMQAKSGRKATSSGMWKNTALPSEPIERGANFTESVYDRESGRNLRTVWRISSQGFKGAHFATYPPKLVEPCIKAGTSERGCCPTCGAPWKRIVEKQRVATRSGNTSKVYVDPVGSPFEQHSGDIIGNRDPFRHVTRTVTTGWQPTCICHGHLETREIHDFLDGSGEAFIRKRRVYVQDADQPEPIPCTVLDPFLGSGTTALMAEHLGRNWLGCELNPDYAEIARQRIAGGYRPPKTKGPPRRRKQRRERLLFN